MNAFKRVKNIIDVNGKIYQQNSTIMGGDYKFPSLILLNPEEGGNVPMKKNKRRSLLKYNFIMI